jgi:hypothetical protein
MVTLVDSFNCVQKTPHPEIDSMKFYPVVKNWSRKICPHLDNPTLQKVLVSDFNKYTTGRWGKRFRLGAISSRLRELWLEMGCSWQTPKVLSVCESWRLSLASQLQSYIGATRGSEKRMACRNSLIHSTVWDGEHTLFDLNGMALFNGDAPECFVLAALAPGSRELALGELDEVDLPRMTYAREIVGLRLKPLYHMPNKYLPQGADKDGGATP